MGCLQDESWSGTVVFEFKTHDLKGGPKFKARLVAQGFSQIPGINFHQTYTPVAKQARFVSSLPSQQRKTGNWIAFDAKRAFLHGRLKETPT